MYGFDVGTEGKNKELLVINSVHAAGTNLKMKALSKRRLSRYNVQRARE